MQTRGKYGGTEVSSLEAINMDGRMASIIRGCSDRLNGFVLKQLETD